MPRACGPRSRDARSYASPGTRPTPRSAAASELVEEYLALARKPGTVAGQHGDAAAVLAREEGVIEAEYVFPYLAHAPMEPLDGFLRWDGKRAVARLGSQLQTGDHQAIAGVLGLKLEQVEVETMLAGGSFGRRAQPTCTSPSSWRTPPRRSGPAGPVKLVWTREDDIRGGYYRPLFVHRMRGAVREGKIAGLGQHHRGAVLPQGLAVRRR